MNEYNMCQETVRCGSRYCIFIRYLCIIIYSPAQLYANFDYFTKNNIRKKGIYLIAQTIDLVVIWGNLPLMTGTAFLLLTNLAHFAKLLSLTLKRDVIQQIIDEGDDVMRSHETEEGREIVYKIDRETKVLHIIYICLTGVTTVGWASSAENRQLPLRAWYPYDTSLSPSYELTYTHQVTAVIIAAYLNVSKDTLVAALIAQCRCRLQLLEMRLRTICDDVPDTQAVLSASTSAIVEARLRACAEEHQRVLTATERLQSCFSLPTFAQFIVSLIIICVTAFQLVSQAGNLVRLFSMGTYLLNMMFQVFVYCYQGTMLSEESIDLANAAYQAPWYKFPVRLRRQLLIVMTRTRRPACLTAGGFTTMSLASFMAIIKASYSLFTLLQQVEERK